MAQATASPVRQGGRSLTGATLMKQDRGALRIGTSGYHYDHWKGVVYPEELSKTEWFSHYARKFDTVEINNTFYRLPEAETFEAWRRQAPKGFCYALKFSRYGSHIVRFHGDHYSGGYAPQALKAQAKWIQQQLGDGKDVFAYFNNDAEGHAVRNAADLRRYVLQE